MSASTSAVCSYAGIRWYDTQYCDRANRLSFYNSTNLDSCEQLRGRSSLSVAQANFNFKDDTNIKHVNIVKEEECA